MFQNEHELILSLNAGSSSLKISLFERQSSGSTGFGSHAKPVKLLLNSSLDNLSSSPAKFSFGFVEQKESDTSVQKEDVNDVTDHASAFSRFLAQLDKSERVDQKQIRYVCHRVVHGGDYKNPIIVSKEAYHHIEALTDLAPLYIFHSFDGILISD
jgi:acetate kinase